MVLPSSRLKLPPIHHSRVSKANVRNSGEGRVLVFQQKLAQGYIFLSQQDCAHQNEDAHQSGDHTTNVLPSNVVAWLRLLNPFLNGGSEYDHLSDTVDESYHPRKQQYPPALPQGMGGQIADKRQDSDWPHNRKHVSYCSPDRALTESPASSVHTDSQRQRDRTPNE